MQFGWAVAQTHVQSERKAVENLRRQHYDAFCPLYTHPSRSNVRELVESPLFLNYIFVRIEQDQPWYAINSTLGVVRLLTTRDDQDPRPLFVRDEKIEEILTLRATAQAPFPPGTLVRVRRRDSSFYDQVGTVVRMSKVMRVSVMMSMFDREVVVEFIDPNDLEVAVVALPPPRRAARP